MNEFQDQKFINVFCLVYFCGGAKVESDFNRTLAVALLSVNFNAPRHVLPRPELHFVLCATDSTIQTVAPFSNTVKKEKTT